MPTSGLSTSWGSICLARKPVAPVTRTVFLRVFCSESGAPVLSRKLLLRMRGGAVSLSQSMRSTTALSSIRVAISPSVLAPSRSTSRTTILKAWRIRDWRRITKRELPPTEKKLVIGDMLKPSSLLPSASCHTRLSCTIVSVSSSCPSPASAAPSLARWGSGMLLIAFRSTLE